MSTSLGPEKQLLVIWRDSVAAGDDLDAPHEMKLPIQQGESIQNIVTRIVATNYLASISGGKATWIAEADSRPLAVVAQQWSQPRFLIGSAEELTSMVDGSSRCHLYFKYWRQAEPNLVFECLRDGKPLPNKYA